MAEGIRISQLPTITALTLDDVFIINDGNATTSKITYDNVKNAISNDVVSVNSVNGQTGDITIDAGSLGVYTIQQSDDALAFKASNVVVGVVNGASDLGVFSGSTIPDNTSVRGALQSLELAVEGGDVEDAILSADNTFTGENTFQGVLTASQNGNIIPFYFDNQAAFPAANTYHGAIAHSHADGAMFFAHGGSWVQLAKASDIPVTIDLSDTYTLLGVTEGETDLGTFTGNPSFPSSLPQISDNVSVKVALQDLSNAIISNNQITVGHVADTYNLVGVSSGQTNLGAFTGTIISNNVSVKTALQELETAVEGVTTFSGSYDDLTDQPTLGTAAATDATAYATAAQGTAADSAVQPTADAITVTSLPTDGTATVDTLAAAINTLTTELAAILNA